MDIKNMMFEQVLQRINQGEDFYTEFKSDRKGQLSTREICEAVVCLTNSEGGLVILGVENDGQITGVQPRTGDQLSPELLRAVIFNNTEPPIDTEVESYVIEGKQILTIRIEGYPGICSTKDGKILRRAIGIRGPECVPFYPYQLNSRLIDLNGLDYSAQLMVNSSWDDLDQGAFVNLRANIRDYQGDSRLLLLDDRELAKALQLVETHQGILKPNVAGLLLLGMEAAIKKFIPTHGVALQIFDKAGNNVQNIFLTESLLSILSKCNETILLHSRHLNPDFFSPNLLNAIDEAIKNALIHRDYSKRGFIYIQCWPDQVLITNPGSFLDSITLSNLITHEPLYRNPRLAVGVYRIGITRNTGSGIDQLYREQMVQGRPTPYYMLSDKDYTRLLLSGEVDYHILAIANEQEKAGNPLSLEKLLIIYRLKGCISITCSQAAALLQKDEKISCRYLIELVEDGILQKISLNNQLIFELAPAYQSFTDKSSDHRWFDSKYQKAYEAIVKQYLEIHQKVTIKDAANVCNLPEKDVKVILEQMLESGILVLLKKNTFELSSKD